ncbi:MAG: DUF3047 domain-containing protein [Kiritimatiellae bacterium]|nr:DUF3047 domain-containing protein [Kiritimatiellia bacterium]
MRGRRTILWRYFRVVFGNVQSGNVKRRLGGWAAVAGLGTLSAMGDLRPVYREEFIELPPGAEVRGRPGTPLARFEIVPLTDAAGGRALRMTAEGASGALLMPVDNVSLSRTPILRWRWRVLEWPTDADGRRPDRDDQAVGLYIGAGRGLRRTSLAYRWETATPVGATGAVSYAGGLVRVHWIALRNRESGTGFVVEERNVADDWRRLVGGEPPERFAISISCNSQYTHSRAVAELDWLEFAPARSASEVEP